jgi:hypothetical protein
MEFVKSVAQWCQKQIETRHQALDLMERGVIKTQEYAADGRKKDTTPRSIDDDRREIAELRELLEKVKHEQSGQPSPSSHAPPAQSQDIAEEMLANSTRPRFSIDDVE